MRQAHRDREALARCAGEYMDRYSMGQEERERAGQVLQTTLEQMEACAAIMETPSLAVLKKHPVQRVKELPQNAGVGCQGVPGAYSHIACEEMFAAPDIRFYDEFEDVFQAVKRGQAEFGVLPVENSSAGAVGEVLSLVYRYGLYCNASVPIKVEHCLCVHPDTDPARVKRVISHPQALMQCAGFLSRRGYEPVKYSNTAAAAKKVGEGENELACLCSKRSARLYGLHILEENAQDYDENYTRFLCISPRNLLLPGADTVSVMLAFPNEPGYLNRLLTRFAVFGLDMSKLLSMPIASKDFHVRFFLDFRGSVEDKRVAGLLSALDAELEDFRYLGNYLRLEG